jgi:hypothetical protein
MAASDPDRKRLARLIRMLGTTMRGERVNAWQAFERAMRNDGISWTDIGDWIERDDGKYTDAELQEYAQIARAAGVEAGIAIGEARARNASNGNGGGGGLSLPRPAEMAEYCHERLAQLKDDNKREFISQMHLFTQRGMRLSPGKLGFLTSIYIQIGGRY